MALSTAGFETPPFICRFVDKIFLSAYFCQKLFFENFQFLALILIFSLSSAPAWFFGPKTIFSKLVNFWPLYSILPQFLPKNSFCQAKPSPSSSSAGWPQLALFSLNPISQGVSISLPPRGGGYLIPPLGNQGRSCFRPHVAKSYFETYKSYDHMQNFKPLSQKFSEILRF